MTCVRCIYHTTVAGYENNGNKIEHLSIDRDGSYGFKNPKTDYKNIRTLGGHVCTYYGTVFNLLQSNCSARDIG